MMMMMMMMMMMTMIPPPGYHEVEENALEADLGGCLSSAFICNKNLRDPSHHDKFMSIKEFEDKPPEAQLLPPLLLGATLDMVMAYVMAWVPLVGRITVKDVSEARPEKYKGEDGIDCDYPFGNKPGRRPDNSPLSGSGYVYSVSNETGRCKSCRASSPGGWWQRVGVDTARHNVYDDVEARSATFTLFNDSPHNPDQVTLTGGEWYGGSTEKQKIGNFLVRAPRKVSYKRPLD